MTGVIVACFILVVLMAAYGLWRRGEKNDRRAAWKRKLQLEEARLIAEAEVHRSREAEVRARRLNAAVENMTQGLIMFDADERLVVINERFISMYGLSRDIVKPGCAFRDVIAYRHALRSVEEPAGTLLRRWRPFRRAVRQHITAYEAARRVALSRFSTGQS